MKELLIFFIGAAGSAAAFILTYRSVWRNLVTDEFKVSIRVDITERKNKQIEKIKLMLEIRHTSPEKVKLNYAYIKLPEVVRGNRPPNPTVGEMFFGVRGRVYVDDIKDELLEYSLHKSIMITNNTLLRELNAKNINGFRIVVNTNKFGDVKSNKVKFTNLGLNN